MRPKKVQSSLEKELYEVHKGIKKMQEPGEEGISPASKGRRSLQRLRSSVRIASQTAASNKPSLAGGFLKALQSAQGQKEVLQGAKTYFESPWLRNGTTNEQLPKLRVASPPGKLRMMVAKSFRCDLACSEVSQNAPGTRQDALERLD